MLHFSSKLISVILLAALGRAAEDIECNSADFLAQEKADLDALESTCGDAKQASIAELEANVKPLAAQVSKVKSDHAKNMIGLARFIS